MKKPWMVLLHRPHQWNSGPSVHRFATEQEAILFVSDNVTGRPGLESYCWAEIAQITGKVN